MGKIEKMFLGTLVEITHLDGSKWEGWRGETFGSGLVILEKQKFVDEANQFVRVYLANGFNRVTSSLGTVIQDNGETLKLQTVRSIYHISYNHDLSEEMMLNMSVELGILPPIFGNASDSKKH